MAGIYVHVPFCHSKCAYCDFYSIANHALMQGYAGSVEQEWYARRDELGAHPIRTIYFGGGTPSLLPVADLSRIAALFPKEAIEEMTIEVNPEDVCTASADGWRTAGINRVSIGVQSLDDKELRAVGRRHSVNEALRAIETIQACGISNISADLIYGLPGQDEASFRLSLEKTVASGVTHISAYCLSYEPGTRLYRMLQQGRVEEASDDLITDIYASLCSTLYSAGYEHYEISNFAKPGMRSKHNSAYWDGTPYLGLGPGAHSLDINGVRRYVPCDIKAYIDTPEAAALVDEENEAGQANDMIMTGLRTSAGLNLSCLPASQRECVLASAERWMSSGVVVRDGQRLTIPEEHWLLSDAVIRDLFIE